MQRLNRVLAEATLSTSCARVATYWSPSGSEEAGGSAGTTFAISKLAIAVSIDLVIKMPLFYPLQTGRSSRNYGGLGRSLSKKCTVTFSKSPPPVTLFDRPTTERRSTSDDSVPSIFFLVNAP